MNRTSDIFGQIRAMTITSDEVIIANDYDMFDYIRSLIDTSTLQPHEKEFLIKNIYSLDWSFQSYRLIEFLKECQPDRIDAGCNYQQTEIKEKIKKMMQQ
jgi:hypothetical protein